MKLDSINEEIKDLESYLTNIPIQAKGAFEMYKKRLKELKELRDIWQKRNISVAEDML